MTGQNIPSRDEFLKTWVPQLPQIARVNLEDAGHWYDVASGVDPQRFDWHFRRLSGFGGSDVGEIGAWELGVPALFNTPQSIISQKLMRRPIEPGDKYTRRGALFEDDLREMFLEDFHARSRPDLAEALRGARPKQHPWARANPDDVVEMRTRSGSKLFVVDYKAASEAKETAPTQYACQTHHYDWMLWCADKDGEPRFDGNAPLATDGLLIVYYDYAAAEVTPIQVPWDGAILRAVVSGGDKAWNHLLGHREINFLPEADAGQPEALLPEEETRVIELERRIVAYKLMADHLYKRYRSLTVDCEKILHDAGRRRKSQIRAPLSRMNVTYQTALDNERLQELCRLAQVDIDSLRSETKTLDAEAMAARLQVLGESPVFKRAFDLELISALCNRHGYRLPLIESGVWKLSQRKAAQEDLEALRANAETEAGKAVQSLLTAMPACAPAAKPHGRPTSPKARGGIESAATGSEGSGVRTLSLFPSPTPEGTRRGTAAPRKRRG
jgi:hypothetical protein